MSQAAARRPISLGVFEMVCPNNGMPTWTHPLGRGDRWDSMGYWIDLARLLDAAGFDFLFFADTYGYPTIDGQLPSQAAEHSIQFPALDPMLLISALAAATSSLGFVLTSPTTVEHPYATSRRFATLDHYTGGRIGWNVVTGSSQATTDALFGVADGTAGDGTAGGGPAAGAHDRRYDVADEFIDLCLQMWEGSWEDDAQARDRDRNIYADPTKLHRIEHRGDTYSSAGVFVVPPSPQRTPTLFQAGTSDRGREFAARNAEAVFIQGQSIASAAAQVADIRAKAAAAGRAADDVAVITSMTVTVAPTRAEALAKRAELEACYGLDDAAVMFAGFTGIDLLAMDPDTSIADIRTEQGQTLLNRYSRPGEPAPLVRDVLSQFLARGIRGFLVTGSPDDVADEIQAIVEQTGVDGIMLEPTFGGPDCYREFAELVVPILRERGLLRPGTARRPATLREGITGEASGRLAGSHPGAAFRPQSRVGN